ncbi:MAG TPA: protein kinase, partial [Verrucomicrobiae bacterium]|nr:protein kinase [Verrucomicrobiae bacterium]
MERNPRCQRCGVALTGQAVGELCANCLLKLALEPPGEEAPLSALSSADDGSPAAPSGIGNRKSEIGNRVRYFGDYELVEEIARGGMGVVYKARQVSLNRTVALKMILAGDFSSPAMVERFQTEAEAAARLEHPNIVPVYEIGTHEGQHYFSMRFLDGGTLTQAMAREKFSPRRTAELVVKVARAVHHAHQRGILHRDLKPGNILFDQAGEPHVADFGLAKVLEHDSSLTQSAAVMGTPSYMAPEQAAGHTKQLSTAADVYSLGAILYELLTGRAPFRGPSPAETLRQVIEVEPKRPHLLNAAVDRDLETLCLKCMEKEPQRRYGSAETLAEDLERWLRCEPVLARPTSGFERTIKWARRRPTVTALAACVVLVATFGIAGVLWQWRNAESARTVAVQKAGAEANAKIEAQQAQRAEAKANEDLRHSLKREQRTAYFRGIALVEQEWLANNLVRADKLLDELGPKELRSWEWHYLKRLCNYPSSLTLRGAVCPGDGIPLSADRKLIALVQSKAINLCDTVTGETLSSFPLQAFKSVALSLDGKLLVACGSHGGNTRTNFSELRVWDTATGKETISITRPASSNDFSRVAFSPDGKLLAVDCSSFSVRSNRSSPNGRQIILWDTASGQEVFRLPFETNRTLHAGPLVFSPKGKTLASGVGEAFNGGTVNLWDLETRQIRTILKRAAATLAFSSNGEYIATGSGKQVTIWDATTGIEVRSLFGNTGGAQALAFSPDGTRLGAGCSDGTVRNWDVASGEELLLIKLNRGVSSIAFSSDGQQLFCGIGRENVYRDEPSRLRITFNSGGIRAIGSADEIKMVDAVASQQVRILKGHSRKGWAVAFSRDGQRLASSSDDKTIKLWNATNHQLTLTLTGHTKAVYGIAFSSNGRRLASASDDKTAKVWNTQTGRELLSLAGHKGGVYTVAFSTDDERIATASEDGTVRMWDANSGQ